MAEHTVSVAEAAAILGCSPEAIRRRIHAGEIDAFAERGAWRVLTTSLPKAPTSDRVSRGQGWATPSLADRLEGRPWLLSPEDIAAVIGWPTSDLDNCPVARSALDPCSGGTFRGYATLNRSPHRWIEV